MNQVLNFANSAYLRLIKFDNHSIRRKKCNYFLIYTVLIICVGFIVFLPFLKSRHSLIWIPDALDQHLVTLRYYSQWLRDIVSNFFATGQFEPVMFDFKFGVGGDVFSNLSFYTIGDPINLLSIFVPKAYIEVFYILSIFFRIYLVGITFSAFCFYMKKGRFQTLMGSLVYAFSGYVLSYSVRHPFFILGMIYLPLLLIGVEKIFRKEKPYVFVASTFIMGVSNFYFLYILSILIFVYALVRFFNYVKEKRLINFFKCFLNFVKYYLLGIVLASFILLPVIAGFLNNGRLGAGGNYTNLFFSQPVEYISIFTNMFNPGANSIGVIPLCLISIVLLFTKKDKKYSSLKWFVVIAVVFACVPLFGYIFNNFNYVSDRWVFAVCYVFAFVFVEMLPSMAKIKPKYIMFVLLLALAARSIYLLFNKSASKVVTITFTMVILSVFILYSIYLLRNSRYKNMYGKVFKGVIGITVCAFVVLGAYTKYSYSVLNYVSQFTKLTNPPNSVGEFSDSPAHLTKEFYDKDFYRIDLSTSSNKLFNYPIEYGYNGLSVYLSTTDSNVFNYGTWLYSKTRDQSPSKYNGFDNRTALNAFAAVKYIAVESGRSQYVPFGYEKIDSQKRSNAVASSYKSEAKKNKTYNKADELYINKYFLPLGYTYDKFITTQEFEKLEPSERQQAMLQAAVVEKPISGYTNADYVKETKKIKYTTETSQGVTKKSDNSYLVKNKNGFVKFKFKGLPNSETYICFNNINMDYPNPSKNPALFLKKGATEKEIQNYQIANKYTKPKQGFYVNIKSGDIRNSVLIRSRAGNFYCGTHDFISNMGYSEDGITECTVNFSEIGTVTFDDISIISVPMDKYPDRINELTQDTLQNIKMGRNSISGEIKLKEDKILQLSVPYSSGWSVTVDGEKKELIKSNVMYSAVALKAGDHEIYLHYKNPYMLPGAVISLSAVVIIGLVWILLRKKRKLKQHE